MKVKVKPYRPCTARHGCYQPAVYSVMLPRESSAMLACAEDLQRAVDIVITIPPIRREVADPEQVVLVSYFKQPEMEWSV